MRLIVTENAAMISDIALEHDGAVLGRDEECEICLNDPRIAPRQASFVHTTTNDWEFQLQEGEPLIKVNGSRVTIDEPVELKTGDEIRICDYVIRVFPAQDKTATASPSQARPTDVAKLTKFVQAQLPSGSNTKKINDGVVLQAAQSKLIGEVSMKLCQADNIENLMDVALQVLISAFTAHHAWIGLRRVNYGPMEYEEGRTNTGQTTGLPKIGDNLKPRVLDRAQNVQIPRLSAKEHLSILQGPLAGPENMLGMIYVDGGIDGRIYDPNDLELFAVIGSLIASQLEAIFAQMARNRAATIAGEVSVAHAIQARVTPRKLPQWKELQFGAFREPGSERTGDFYDIVRLANGMAYVMVANTPTVGPIPSMLISMCHASFRFAAMHQDAPNIVLKSLNWMLFDGQKDRPLDVFIGAIEPQTGLIRYSIAGTLGSYIIGTRGDERSLIPDSPCPPLGMSRTGEYPLLEETLEPEETLSVFTPGGTTVKNPQGDAFGEQRFVDILCDAFGQSPTAMLNDLMNDLRAFKAGGAQPDDVTVVLAHRL